MIDNFSPRVDLRRGQLGNFRRDRFFWYIYLASLGALALQISIVSFAFRKLPVEIPLFYSRPWGSEILASKVFIFLLPAIVITSLAVNYVFLVFVAKDDTFLLRILLIFSFLVSVGCLFGTFKIISLLV